MIYPSISELTDNGKINRYTLVVATAKCARIITDEYVKQRDYAEKLAMNKESDKSKNIANLIKKEYRDEKAVKNAINGLHNGEFRILSEEEAADLHQKQAEEEARRKAEEVVLLEETEEEYDDEEDMEDADAAAAADALELLMGAELFDVEDTAGENE